MFPEVAIEFVNVSVRFSYIKWDQRTPVQRTRMFLESFYPIFSVVKNREENESISYVAHSIGKILKYSQ